MPEVLIPYGLTASFVLLGLMPGLAAMRWLRLPACFAVPITLAAGALIAYGMFWLYFFARELARSATPLIVLVSAVGAAVMLHRSRELRALLRERDAWLPGALMLSLMIAYLAYLAWPGVTSTVRFTVPLPPEDNLVPRYLADNVFLGFYEPGTTPPPITTFMFETRSSDRPPLQSAVVLAVRAIGPGRGAYVSGQWTYQVLTTFCQIAWVPALYALARTLLLTPRQTAFVLIAAATSGFFVVHSLYTWPKLFAAWLFLTALAIVLAVIRRQLPARVPLAIATGVLLALSLLAHGGPFFSIVALPLLLAQRGAWRRFAPRHALAAGMAAAVVLTPWLAYQRFYDPPGNRLLKIHLAGVEAVDARTTLETLRDTYARITLREYLTGRWENAKEQWLVFGKSGDAPHPVDWVQWQQFFHHLPALDTLLLGFLGATPGWRFRRDDASREDAPPGPREFGLPQLAWYTLGALLIWMLLLFVPGSAMIHHGSFATTALLFVCAAAFAARLPRPVAGAILLLHVAIFVTCWLAMRVLGNPPHVAWRAPYAVLMVAAFAAFIGLALSSGRPAQPPAFASRPED
jgi:hypothetical protein